MKKRADPRPVLNHLIVRWRRGDEVASGRLVPLVQLLVLAGVRVPVPAGRKGELVIVEGLSDEEAARRRRQHHDTAVRDAATRDVCASP